MSLKQLRADIGMTQSELADKSGLRQATLSSLENGRTKAQGGTTTALAAAMGCSVEVIREALENSVSTAKELKPNQAESRFNADQNLGDLRWNWQSAQRAVNGHKKQWKEAMMFLDPILKKHPEFLEARKLMRYAAVQAALKIPFSDRIPPPQSYIGKAQKLAAEGQPFEAIEMLEEKVFVYLPTNIDANNALHEAATVAELTDTARFALEFSASHNPNKKQALQRLSSYYDQIGELDKSCEILERIKQLDPNDLDAIKDHRNMSARASMEQGHIERKDHSAAIDLQQRERIALSEEQKVELLATLINDYQQNSDDIEAKNGLRRAVAIARELGENRIEALEQALSIQQTLINEFPQDPVLVSQLDEITLLIQEKRLQLAKQDPNKQNELDQLQDQKNKTQLDVAQRAVLANPTSAEAQLKLGQAHIALEQYREAINPLQKAKSDPRSGIDIAAMSSLADCYVKGKLNKLAISEIEQALVKLNSSEAKTDVQWMDLKYKKALLFLDMDKSEEANELFAEIFSKDSNYKDVEARVWKG